LDSFTFAFPLLRKYKLKATIWVNPDFVDNNDDRIRPTLEDYWNGKKTLEELNSFDGFLNWAEMRKMEKSGFIDIQSHTLTHTKYPVSDKIVDFVSPSTKIDWLYWNLFPEDKPYFLSNPHFKIPLGYPIYKSERSNIARIYQENGILTNQIVNYVKVNGEEKFFNSQDWKEKLFNLSSEIINKSEVNYKKESDDEYKDRLKFELIESKRIIEKNLHKSVNHLCWPFGGRNEDTIKMAEEIGYITTTAKSGKNIFNKKLFQRVERMALDNPKYQNYLFYFYAFYKLYGCKF